MFEQALASLEEASRIIIHRHTHPDGDAMGSQLGLAALLRANYPEKEVYCVGDAAGRYAFMQNAPLDTVDDEAYVAALAVILDTSAEALISDERWKTAPKTLRIDHHLFCGQIAETEVIDPSFESCAGMIAAMAEECNWKLTSEAATALFTGMVTDSGRFRYDATNTRTFRSAAYLMQAEIDTNKLYMQLYSDSLENLKLRSSFIARIRTTEHGVAYLYNDLETVRESGLDQFSVSRGMVGTMSDLRGLPIWVNFTENTEGGVDCELRSSLYNINPIAVAYGGGGHQKASGAHVADRETAMAMLADLDKLAKELSQK